MLPLSLFVSLYCAGDLDKLDPYVRRKMAQRLDPSIGADWRELAKRLGLGTLESAFALHSSPTIQVLAHYEVLRACCCLFVVFLFLLFWGQRLVKELV